MRRQHGFTLIEIAIALAVLAIVTGAALAGVIAYTRRGQVQRAVSEVDTIAKAAAQWPSLCGCANFNGLSLGELINRGLVDDRMSSGGANPWGGVYWAGHWSWDPPRFYVALNAVPSWAAGDIVRGFGRRADLGGYDGYNLYIVFR